MKLIESIGDEFELTGFDERDELPLVIIGLIYFDFGI
jgi:hypothetical protein